MILWTDSDGHPIVDADGHPIDCVICPCEAPAGPSCCLDGVVRDGIYIWGYMSAAGGNSQLVNRCLPSVCAALMTNGAYVSYGPWSAGTFDWNNGIFSKSGTLGCANVRVIGSCEPQIGAIGNATLFRCTIDFDLGAGYIGAQVFTNSNVFNNPNFFCDLDLGGFSYTQADATYPSDIDFYLTQRDPATGILTDDGASTVVPTVFTFSITLLDATGTPTLYSCDMVFAPVATNVFGKQFGWLGWLNDCAGGSCTRISLWFDEGSVLWTITALTSPGVGGGAGTNVNIYSGAAFPTAGMATGNWPDCGGGATTTPMWST